MPDIRCPMCGKPNPGELEVCQFCQARLKPLILHPEPPESNKPATPPNNPPAPSENQPDSADWLNSLREDDFNSVKPNYGREPEVDPQPGSNNGHGNSSDEPDWLARIRGLKNEEPEKPSTPVPDWLSDFENSPDRGTEENAGWMDSLQTGSTEENLTSGADEIDIQPNSIDDEPEWLRNLREQHQPGSAEPTEPPQSTGSSFSPDDLPSEPVEPAQPAGSEASANGTPLPEWLAFEPEETSPNPEESGPEPGADQNINDWLDRLADQPAANAAASPEVPLPPATDGPALTWDFLNNDDNASAWNPSEAEAKPSDPSTPGTTEADNWFSSGPSDELPDWLASQSAEPHQPAQPEAGEDRPDWLSADGKNQPTSFVSPNGKDNLPQWLPPSSPAEPSTPPAADPEGGIPGWNIPGEPEETPDWLQSLQPEPEAESNPFSPADQPAAAPEPTSEPPAEAAPTEAPTRHWFDSDDAPEAQEDAAFPGGADQDGDISVPDWLEKFRAEIPSPDPGAPWLNPDQPAAETGTSSNATGTGLPDLGAVFTPSAPAEPTAPSDETPVAEIPTFEPPATPEEPALDFGAPQANLEPQQPANGDEPPAPFIASDLPDWLEQLAPNGTPETAQPAPAELESAPEMPSADGEELAPAELPSWVQAMRPVETVAPTPAAEQVDEQLVEASGPLAGLKGILPAEPVFTGYRKPPIYASNLQITDKQGLQRELFDQLLTTEGQPQPDQLTTTAASKQIWRILVALVLLAAILYPILTGSQIVPVPVATPKTEAVWTAIDELPDNAPVLIAVDYQPGLSGEIEASAAPVLRHLVLKGSRLAFISTSPTGPALADQLVKSALTSLDGDHAAYTNGEKIANLGYLAGGTTAVASFANQQLASDQPALQGVQDLSGFAQMIIITDDPDTARAWIEQIQPMLDKTRLFVISSAQAAPLLGPYVDSQQIAGFVSGLAGGAAYEQLLQQPGTARAYWDAYQAGLLAAALLIVIGALVVGIRALISSIKNQR